MISRPIMALDRVATLVLSLALLTLGLLGIWWWTGTGPLPTKSSTTPVQDVVATGWWPWASALLGLLLVYLGIRWLAAHLSRSTVTELQLRGSGKQGTLIVTAGKVTDAAAESFADTLGVRSAKGTMIRDRGQLVAKITAVVEAYADLPAIAKQADRVAAEFAHVLGRDDLRCRVELRVARRSKTPARVS